MRFQKLTALICSLGMVFSCGTATIVSAEETTTSVTVTDENVDSTGLIDFYSLSLSGSTRSVYITAATYG
ncbi:MAG: hypothetical protein K6E36_00145, partial [Oscillospiraceae bacterium]|nr:hypothetical protein [Oscillospiraceae bacterium]